MTTATSTIPDFGFETLQDLINTVCEKFADRPAFTSGDVTLSFDGCLAKILCWQNPPSGSCKTLLEAAPTSAPSVSAWTHEAE